MLTWKDFAVWLRQHKRGTAANPFEGIYTIFDEELQQLLEFEEKQIAGFKQEIVYAGEAIHV